jgi:2-polyprenyl-6-methoxyphenol hydroxylase-like FAD-dependent oxidoreductase
LRPISIAVRDHCRGRLARSRIATFSTVAGLNEINIYGNAVVAGGGVAGLLIASSLARHFSHVTVVERDVLPTEAGVPRRGVPQDRHLHILLAAGREAMEKLVPGMTADLISDGAVTVDPLGDTRWILEGHRAKRANIGVTAIQAGRALLEGRIRARVRTLDNVSFRDGHEVTELVLDDSKTEIIGVQAAPAGDPHWGELFEADLFVDATGRGARGLGWLRDAGLESPEEEKTTIEIAYTTRRFRRHPGDLNGDQAIIITPSAENPRGGAVNSQEDGTWIVTLFGYLGKEAPRDLGGFKEFARKLPAPDIHELLSDAAPLGDGTLIRFPTSRRRRYETLEALPNNYVVVGDALCSFNPIYAQGMTVAALAAERLDTVLREKRGGSLLEGAGLTGDFYARITPVVDAAWAAAVGGDLKYPQVEGARSLEWQQFHDFLNQVYQATSRDVEVSRVLVRVLNFLDGAEALQDSAFIARVRNAAA